MSELGRNQKQSKNVMPFGLTSKVVLAGFLTMLVMIISMVIYFMGPYRSERLAHEENVQLARAMKMSSVLYTVLAYIPETTLDWASWDDTYNFAIGENPHFEAQNYAVSPLDIYDINFFLIMDKDKHVISQLEDYTSGINVLPLAAELANMVNNNMMTQSQPSPNAAQVAGFVSYEGRVYYVCARPILNSTETKNSGGVLLMGREISQFYLNTLLKKHFAEALQYQVLSSDQISLSEKMRAALNKDGTVVDLSVSLGIADTFVQQTDIYGDASIAVHVQARMEDFQASSKQIHGFLLVAVAMIIILMMALYVSIRKLILNPLKLLTEQVAGVTENSLEAIKPAMFRDKEFITLAESVIHMVDTINYSAAMLQTSNENLRVYSQAIRSAYDEIVIFTVEGIIEYVNPATEKTSPFATGEYIGKKVLDCIEEEYHAEYYKVMAKAKHCESWRGELPLLQQHNVYHTYEVSVSPIMDAGGICDHVVAILRDVDEQRRISTKLTEFAQYDALTHLPNRRYFSELFQERKAEAREMGQLICLFFIDLDEFKFVNDSYGHNVGDLLVWEIAQRLLQHLPENTVLSRAGGDEFYIMAYNLSPVDEAYPIGQLILTLMRESFFIEGHTISIGVSIGSSVYPTDATDLDSLLKNADMAMYEVKATGKHNYCQFDVSIANKVLQQVSIEAKLRDALLQDCREFVAFYQPKVDPARNRIVGCEALIRWITPTGMISPDQFIPVAERTGLLWELSRHMLKISAKFQQTLASIGYHLHVSVNMSPRVMLHPEFMQIVEESISYAGMNPHNLDIEITEETLALDVVSLGQVIAKLHAKGISVTIDDFGTGYSSIGYFKKFALDRLKIDKSFIDGLPNDGDNVTIVESTWAMAKSMKLLVTAEGVETAEQVAYLRDLGIHELQGYYFSKPLSERDFIAYISEFDKSKGETL